MKLWMTALAFVASVLWLRAEDITLTGGLVLRDAQILSQAPTTVTIRHSGGFSQVEKAKLPPDLAEQYPIDQAAAEAQRKAELIRAWRLKHKAAGSDPFKRPIQIEPQPFLRDDNARQIWRRHILALDLEPSEMDGLRWETVFEQRDVTCVNAKLSLERPYWRITIEINNPGGRFPWASALVSDSSGNKLAAWFLRGGFNISHPKASAIGNAPGEATIDVETSGVAVAVIVEQAVLAD